MPPFFRACKLFVRTHTSSISRSTFPAWFSSRNSAGRPRRLDDNSGLEFAHNSELPRAYGSKTAWYKNTASASRDENVTSYGSQENMVPLGKIAVRHDVYVMGRDPLRLSST